MKPATTRRKPAAQCEPNSQVQSNKTMPNEERPNMRVMEIFDRSASDHSLEPLDPAELVSGPRSWWKFDGERAAGGMPHYMEPDARVSDEVVIGRVG
jgi:hypothetical protein